MIESMFVKDESGKGGKSVNSQEQLTKSDHSVQKLKYTRKEFKSKNVQIVKKMRSMLCSDKTSQVEFELDMISLFLHSFL